MSNSPCEVASSQDGSDSDLLSSEIGIQRETQRGVHFPGSHNATSSIYHHRNTRKTCGKKPKPTPTPSERFLSMSESDEDDLGSFKFIDTVTFNPDFEFLNSDLKHQRQLAKETLNLEERHFEKLLVTPEGPIVFYPMIPPLKVSLASALPSSLHKVLYEALSLAHTCDDDILDCLNSGLIQMWLKQKRLAPEAWLHQWLLDLAAFHPCLDVSECASDVLVNLIGEHFLSKFYQVMGASWFVGEGVSSDAAAGRTMPLPGEPVNSVLYTNMGPVMRALAAYLRAGCHGLDEKGLVELVVKLAYSAIDVGVKISCKMATNYALSEAINAIHENAWEERSSDGSSTGVVMRRRSLICGKAFEIIEMLLAPSALDLSKEKNPFLFVELVRGLPHTVRGALLRRGFCHKILLKLLKGSSYEIKTEGLHCITEAGHPQALLVFEVLSNCEVGLAEGSDEANMRVYTSIAMSQQLIHADPPKKRMQYKHLQEATFRIHGRLLKSRLSIVSRSRQLLELVTAELRAGAAMI